jgi:hypothetical protein
MDPQEPRQNRNKCKILKTVLAMTDQRILQGGLADSVDRAIDRSILGLSEIVLLNTQTTLLEIGNGSKNG